MAAGGECPAAGGPAAQEWPWPRRPPLPQPGTGVPARLPLQAPGAGRGHGGWRKRKIRDCVCKSRGAVPHILVHFPVLVHAEMGSF